MMGLIEELEKQIRENNHKDHVFEEWLKSNRDELLNEYIDEGDFRVFAKDKFFDENEWLKK